MAPSITLDTSSATLRPPITRGRDRPSSLTTTADKCPACVRARSAPDMFSTPPHRTMYSGERLAAVNRALAAAALDHVLGEPFGLGSPSFDDEGKEVARFRVLQRHVLSSSLGVLGASPNPSIASSSTASTPRSRVGSMSTTLSSNSSRPSFEHSRDGNAPKIFSKRRGETLEFRARFTLVKGARPDDWRYRVTDDWSNAEAFIRATPKFRHIVADVVTRLFARRSSMGGEAMPGDADGKDTSGLGIRAVNDGECGIRDLKSSRQLPRPPRGARQFS